MAKQTGTTWGTPRASAVARWATRLVSRKRRWRSESIVGSVGWQDFALIHAGPLPLCRHARLVADMGSSHMLIGFDLPTRGALASPETIARLAIEGEAMGFDYLTLSDHIVIPRDIEDRYPYSSTGEFPSGGRTDWYEQLTSAAFVAAKTSRLRMVTSVMVVPHRPAVLTAKMLATIDLLSDGRLTVGCGAGWLKEEFAALGVPPFAERGDVVDEYLSAFRELWTKEAPRFAGRYVRFGDIVFAPKPRQQPHPPLWVG